MPKREAKNPFDIRKGSLLNNATHKAIKRHGRKKIRYQRKVEGIPF